LEVTSSVSVYMDRVLPWPSFSSIIVIVLTWGESQVKSMFNFFFVLCLVNYPWFYTYDELLSILILSGVNCLCSCFFWTTIILYSNISMNTYFPCPRNYKTLGQIDYSRNCSNFLGFFSFLPSIVYPQKISCNCVYILLLLWIF